MLCMLDVFPVYFSVQFPHPRPPDKGIDVSPIPTPYYGEIPDRKKYPSRPSLLVLHGKKTSNVKDISLTNVRCYRDSIYPKKQ